MDRSFMAGPTQLVLLHVSSTRAAAGEVCALENTPSDGWPLIAAP